MLKHLPLENVIEEMEKKIKELEIRNDKLNIDLTDLFSEINISPKQLTQFIGDKENFTEKNWEQLQAQKMEIEQKLETELSSIRNPARTKQALKELITAPHWLFVK